MLTVVKQKKKKSGTVAMSIFILKGCLSLKYVFPFPLVIAKLSGDYFDYGANKTFLLITSIYMRTESSGCEKGCGPSKKKIREFHNSRCEFGLHRHFKVIAY